MPWTPDVPAPAPTIGSWATSVAVSRQASGTEAGFGAGALAATGIVPPRNERIIFTVASGCSSISQWPESGITPSVTFVAAKRITVAIIGPNAIVERPVVQDGQIVVRKMMNLSSSFDHRVVDGYDAAVFINRIKAVIEHPATLFMD